jgi:hypothetical protein
LLTITVGGLTEEWFVLYYHYNTNHSSVKPPTIIVNNITYHNNTNHSSVKPPTVIVNNITYHYNTNHFTVGGLTKEWFVLLW